MRESRSGQLIKTLPVMKSLTTKYLLEFWKDSKFWMSREYRMRQIKNHCYPCSSKFFYCETMPYSTKPGVKVWNTFRRVFGSVLEWSFWKLKRLRYFPLKSISSHDFHRSDDTTDIRTFVLLTDCYLFHPRRWHDFHVNEIGIQ